MNKRTMFVSEVKVITEPEQWGKHNNGGDYGFTERYFRNNNKDPFSVEYGTTAEFEYCHITGNFQNCKTCMDYDHETGKCEAEHRTVTEEELLKTMKRIDNGEEERTNYTFEMSAE